MNGKENMGKRKCSSYDTRILREILQKLNSTTTSTGEK